MSALRRTFGVLALATSLLVGWEVPARDDPAETSSYSSVPRIEYSIWNDTGRTVRFRLPSGRNYRLGPGERGRYHNTGTNLQILVHNSGRRYTLRSGAHKFWWNRRAGRIGFDQNYR